LGPEGGRPDSPTQTVRHTCSANVGIVKILRYFKNPYVEKYLYFTEHIYFITNRKNTGKLKYSILNLTLLTIKEHLCNK
jgi:hypothetical protein